MTELQVAESNTEDPRVFDGQRFMNIPGGTFLAEADTKSEAPRWTEMKLYRTRSGKYVLGKVGRSDVYHGKNCSQNSKGVRYDDLDAAEVAEAQNAIDDNPALDRPFIPCMKCNPGSDPRPVFVERDIYSASIYETVQDLSESLFKPGSDNMKFLTRLGRKLLSRAADSDDIIASFLRTPIDVE